MLRSLSARAWKTPLPPPLCSSADLAESIISLIDFWVAVIRSWAAVAIASKLASAVVVQLWSSVVSLLTTSTCARMSVWNWLLWSSWLSTSILASAIRFRSCALISVFMSSIILSPSALLALSDVSTSSRTLSMSARISTLSPLITLDWRVNSVDVSKMRPWYSSVAIVITSARETIARIGLAD